MMTRRELLAIASSVGVARGAPAATPRFIKSICSVIFQKEQPRQEAFALAKSAGFDAVEVSIGYDFPLDLILPRMTPDDSPTPRIRRGYR